MRKFMKYVIHEWTDIAGGMFRRFRIDWIHVETTGAFINNWRIKIALESEKTCTGNLGEI